MLKRLVVLSGALIGLAAIGLPQDDTSGISGLDSIAVRQASLDLSQMTFRWMVDAIKTGHDAKSQGDPAAALAKWAKALPRLFPAGTGKGETSANTHALPAIWQDRAGFDRAAANYAAATGRLAALAAANDTAGFRKQLDEVLQACISCHSRYKERDPQGPQGK